MMRYVQSVKMLADGDINRAIIESFKLIHHDEQAFKKRYPDSYAIDSDICDIRMESFDTHQASMLFYNLARVKKNADRIYDSNERLAILKLIRHHFIGWMNKLFNPSYPLNRHDVRCFHDALNSCEIKPCDPLKRQLENAMICCGTGLSLSEAISALSYYANLVAKYMRCACSTSGEYS
jgi:hypothetical protein